MTRRLLRVVLWERGAVGQDAQSVRGVGFGLPPSQEHVVLRVDQSAWQNK